MGRYIVKLDDFYLEWSTIVDAPVTYGMSRDEMKAYLLEEHGRAGMEDIEERLARCDEKGTSSFSDASAMETIRFNRAGANELCVTRDEIIRRYCTEKPGV